MKDVVTVTVNADEDRVVLHTSQERIEKHHRGIHVEALRFSPEDAVRIGRLMVGRARELIERRRWEGTAP